MKSSQIGTLTVDSSDNPVVLGGEDASMAVDVPRVVSRVFLGPSATISQDALPEASIDSWKQFVESETVQDSTVQADGAQTMRASCWLLTMALWIGAWLTL